MDLQHRRHSAALADPLDFGRSFARLGMPQPPLPQSIQRLETSLGVQLFQWMHTVSRQPSHRDALDQLQLNLPAQPPPKIPTAFAK